jgi:predicted alpha/beta superfamily hydrolase
VDEHDMKNIDNELKVIRKYTDAPFHLIVVKINNWQTELTPWTAPPVFGKEPFGNSAADTLSFITSSLLAKYGATRVLLGGYSLAGLFALWAGCNSGLFDGIAAVSPSVWYPQWMEYAEVHHTNARLVYLSLGDKEDKTKNQIMARVGNCIRRQHELLKQQNAQTVLEWNEGNHFRDPDIRMAKGFAWIMNNMQ